MTIAQAAENLADNKAIMDSYEKFYEGKGWFYTTNSSLGGSALKPGKFPLQIGFENWWKYKLTEPQRAIIKAIGEFKKKDAKKEDYYIIKRCYDKWNKDYRAVFYGKDARWACNLFVGEAMDMAGIHILNSEGKYYSAREIWDAQGPFSIVPKDKVQPGHVAAFEGKHVEIVTKVETGKGFFSGKTTFCSRGAGRGIGDGDEWCGAQLVHADRYIEEENIKFLTV